MTGLRERKKQRTHDALVRAAVELFVTHGYEATTVDDVTSAVEVSQRTFFRYFSNKEEVALSLHGLVQDRFFEAVCARPASESPITALRSSLEGTWTSIGEAIEEVVPLQTHMRMWQVIETTPALLAAHLRASLEMEERLAAELARRTGVDIATDPRPRVLVAAFSGVMRAAGHYWGSGRDVSVETARRLTESYVEQLGPALSEDWGQHPKA